MAQYQRKGELAVISFGLAVGVVWSAGVFLLAIASAFFEWGTVAAMMFSSLYVGYGPSFVGSIAGAVWGFVNGFLFGIAIAFLYNVFLRRRTVHLPESHPQAPPPEPRQAETPPNKQAGSG